MCDDTIWWHDEDQEVLMEGLGKAKAIVDAAIEDEMTEFQLVDDPEKVIEEAGRLVEMAIEAWEDDVKGPEVERVLKLDAEDEDEFDDDEAFEALKEYAKSDDDSDDSDDDGADDSSSDDDDAGEESGEVDFTTTPPFEDYGKLKISEIMEKVNESIEEFDDDVDAANELLAHVWEYEKAHKERERLVSKLEALAEERGLLEDGDGDDSGSDDGEPESSSEPEPEPDEDEKPKPRRRSKAKEEPTGDDEYDDLMAQVQKKLDDIGLAPPQKLPEEKVTMPFDVRNKSDAEIQSLHSAQLAYLARANYTEAYEWRMAQVCKYKMDDLEEKLILSTDKLDPSTDKAKTVTQLQAEVHQDDEYRKWKKRYRKHHLVAEDQKRQAKIYGDNVEGLSRQVTMRKVERESK